MARLKGSGRGMNLTPAQLTELSTDVLGVGNNAVARYVGVSKQYTSQVINGKERPSPRIYRKMKKAVVDLRNGIETPQEEEVIEAMV